MTQDEQKISICKVVDKYLTNDFTGRIDVILHCRDGGIGRISVRVEKDFTKKDLQIWNNDDILHKTDADRPDYRLP